MASHQLKQLLGKGFSIAACVGLIVGLGIMRTPGEIANSVSDPTLYMTLWIVGGLFTLLTIVTVAELISMTPRSGGVYALVRKAYGPYPGFVVGWADAMANCASGALKAVVLAEYLSLLLPAVSPFKTMIAVSVTTTFALLQFAGIRAGSRIQRTASVGFGLIMIGLACALFYSYLTAGQAEAAAVVVEAGTGQNGLAQWGLVITAVVFTYDGWFAPSYFSGESNAGPRSVAEGAIRGVLLVMAFYVLLNFGLVLAVPLNALVGHELALAGAIEIVFGSGTGVVVVLAAIFILLSHQNTQYMIVSRTLYSLSVDGLGSERATNVSELGTPTGAVVATWVFIVSLIFAGGFLFLISLTTFLLMITYLGVLVGVFRMRKIAPDAERPFKAWGYPWVSGAVVTCWLGIISFVAFSKPESVVYAALLVGISAPAYWWVKRARHLDEKAVA